MMIKLLMRKELSSGKSSRRVKKIRRYNLVSKLMLYITASHCTRHFYRAGMNITDLISVGDGLVNKIFNLDHSSNTIRDGAFIIHMCIACDKT